MPSISKVYLNPDATPLKFAKNTFFSFLKQPHSLNTQITCGLAHAQSDAIKRAAIKFTMNEKIKFPKKVVGSLCSIPRAFWRWNWSCSSQKPRKNKMPEAIECLYNSEWQAECLTAAMLLKVASYFELLGPEIFSYIFKPENFQIGSISGLRQDDLSVPFDLLEVELKLLLDESPIELVGSPGIIKMILAQNFWIV